MKKFGKYQIWTDGSAYWKDQIGGWAFLVSENKTVIFEDLGFDKGTSSARMEMTAVLQALKYANKNYKGKNILIVTDYATVVNCFKERWYRIWQQTNFSGISNRDLWEQIFKHKFSKVNTFRFKHVRGHTGITFNERVDFLAGEARKFYVEKLKEND